jgi:transposase
MKRLQISGRESIREQIQLYFTGNDEARYIHRLDAILMFTEKENESCNSAGTLLGHSPRTISNWIRRVNETGDIESLRSKKQSGRPSRLSEAQRQELKSHIIESIDSHAVSVNKWDGKRLAGYIKEQYGIVMKPRTCQRLFHQLGIKPKRAYAAAVRADSESKSIHVQKHGRK